jgi:hypothetical protein
VTSLGNVFGSPDDYCTYAARFFEHGCMYFGDDNQRSIFRVAWDQGTGQGRFYQVFYYTLAQIPFLPGSFLVLRVIRFVTTALLLQAVFAFSNTLFGKLVGFISPLLFVAIYSVNGDYNALTGLPLWFALGQILLLYSVVAAFKYVGTKKLLWFLIFIVCFTLGTLSYEAAWLIALPLFTCLLVVKAINVMSIRIAVTLLRPIWISIIAFGAIYGLIYLYFLGKFPSSYSGTKIDVDNFGDFARTTAELGVGHILRNAFTFNQFLTSIEFLGFLFVSLILCIYFFVKLCNSIDFNSLTLSPYAPKKSQAFAIVGTLVIAASFLPGALLALTSRYREISLYDPLYLTSLYAAVLQAIGGALILASWFSSIKKTSAISLVLSAIFYFALANTGTNFIIYKSQTEKEWLFNAATDAVKNYFTVNSSDLGLTIDVKELASVSSSGAYNFWKPYLYSRTGLELNLVRIESMSKDRGAYLEFRVDDQAKQVYLVIKKDE